MLEERLNEEMKQALKSGQQFRLGTLRMMRSQVLLEKKKGTVICTEGQVGSDNVETVSLQIGLTVGVPTGQAVTPIQVKPLILRP